MILGKHLLGALADVSFSIPSLVIPVSFPNGRTDASETAAISTTTSIHSPLPNRPKSGVRNTFTIPILRCQLNRESRIHQPCHPESLNSTEGFGTGLVLKYLASRLPFEGLRNLVKLHDLWTARERRVLSGVEVPQWSSRCASIRWERIPYSCTAVGGWIRRPRVRSTP